MAKKKKIPAPKGLELRLERPMKIKTDQLKRDIADGSDGRARRAAGKIGLTSARTPMDNLANRLKNMAKVQHAFELGRKKK